MSEQVPEFEKTEYLYAEEFPYPKLVQTFNYFFPKEKNSPDIFTMKNLRRFSRFAPYLAIIILLLIFGICVRDGYVIATVKDPPGKYGIYSLFDLILLIAAPIQYLWWLGAALFAKLLKRSPVIPLVLSFVGPFKTLGIMCVIHFVCGIGGCIVGWIASIGP